MKRTSPKSPASTLSLRLRDAAAWRAIRKPFRLQLLEAARVEGGVSAQALAARVGITPQLMLYHLQLLEKARLLRHEGGRRARGQGGRFHATHQAVAVLTDAGNAAEMRRLGKVLEAIDREAREGRDPLHPSRGGARWEHLTASEARLIERCMHQVSTILDGAARRRSAGDTIPDATHVVRMSIARVRPGFLPAADFLCRSTGRARR